MTPLALPSQDALISLARQTAQQLNLPPALVCALIEQESSWNPWAIRYEPAFFDRYIAPQHLNPTEAHARAFSYGLMQVMGQVARELGFTGAYLAALCDPQTAIEYGCRKLKNCLSKANGVVEDALLRYNGGGNKDYPREVLARVGKY